MEAWPAAASGVIVAALALETRSQSRLSMISFGELHNEQRAVPRRVEIGVAEQVERANHLTLVAQRHGQLRPRARHHRQIPRVRIDIVEQDGPLLRHRRQDLLAAGAGPRKAAGDVISAGTHSVRSCRRTG